MYFVYILECADTTLYVGITNNLEKRIYAHNHLKTGAKYTRVRRPVVLRYHEVMKNSSAAKKREYELKRLTRAQKQTLFKK